MSQLCSSTLVPICSSAPLLRSRSARAPTVACNPVRYFYLYFLGGVFLRDGACCYLPHANMLADPVHGGLYKLCFK